MKTNETICALTAGLLLAGVPALARPAEKYRCRGTDTSINQAVSFELVREEWSDGVWGHQALENLVYEDGQRADFAVGETDTVSLRRLSSGDYALTVVAGRDSESTVIEAVCQSAY